jgi:signal transduction histidine kinase
MTIERVNFDLRQLLEEVADLLAPRASAKRLELACAIPPALPEHVVGDPHRIRQVLINLLGNGIKFTDVGRVTLEAESRDRDGAHAASGSCCATPASASRRTAGGRVRELHAGRTAR